MQTEHQAKIVVETLVQAPLETVWKLWTSPAHITQWNHASDEWHTPQAENDLRVGGKFRSRMEARDGSMGFDFEGVYEAIKLHEHIAYVLEDGRKVEISFADQGGHTQIIERFDPETENPTEMQQAGWQAILTNFQQYAESTLT